ncbi:glycosyltransferase family 1 protein [Pseudoalteromonas sp. S201]|uniref:glycosyltransferase family 4 protein n=1 Tax=unclassified Pseudoalteromonas TaxID=194690 RepID=UPI00110AC0E4|nr:MULTISPECIES: glycosyltransferase family 4 protein [unclassified Pseudoalteromonas]TMP50784.1 glycosyltransferase family 1 protein [Pseudoalteromonas sp. S1688]TMS92392.1 glycosyltransferase family 1 protein [Pseudoalteromonas sp. S201]
MKQKVLVISVSCKGLGGVASVVSTFMNNDFLNSKYNINYFYTNKPGNKFKKLFSTLYAFVSFPFLLIFNNYKVAHIHGGSVLRKSYYALWLKLFGIPIIYQNHAANLDSFYTNAVGVKKAYISYIFSLYDLRLCLGSYWENTLNKVMDKKWDVLYNPVPELHLNNTAHDTCNFTFMGELSERKGIKDLIHAFAKSENDNARLLVAGNGDVDSLVTLCSEIGISEKVEFLGWINKEQKLDLLARTDVVVLPSYAEGLPMSILEAMSVGLPVITTPVGAVEDAITHNEHGLLVNPGNIAQISSALSELAQSSDKRTQLGEAAKVKFLKCFKDDVVAKTLSDYYQQLITKAEK